MYTIILAASTRDANTYAKVAGLKMGRFRYATQASSIKGLRVADIVELPGFERRPDRHALNSALRYSKGERRVVSVEEFSDLRDAFAQARKALPLERAAVIAHRYEAIKEASRGEETGTPEPRQDPAPAPKPPKRRTPAAPKPAAPAEIF